MNDSRSFSAQNLSVPELTTSLNDWLIAESFDCQVLRGEDNATVIQIAKHGNWRKFVGMSTALNIVLRQSETNLVVDIGAGRWIDKAAVGTVSLFLLWPLAVTAAFGTWQQMKMPERVFGHISHYISKPRAVLVHMDSERQKVTAATEKVQVPSGVHIKVTRSRTVEHTVSIQWSMSTESSFSMGDKELFSASIRKGVEEKLGQAYKESETIEYQIDLDGNQSSEYTLNWIDTLCTGNLEFLHGDKIAKLPFEFREQTELLVTPK